jgi:hypothetical protein
VWESTVDGRILKFHLAGINNQNFIMRDEETGSWWQQITGEAIQGPMKGKKLKAVYSDEITFARWKQEQPNGRILQPDPRIAASGGYDPWEKDVAKMPVRVSIAPDQRLEPRALVVGLTVNQATKAYPFTALQKQSPIIDTLGGTSVMIVLDSDGQSIRAFDRTVDGRKLEFFAKPSSNPLVLVDAETGSEWDFTGTCIHGSLAGKQLNRITALKDFWFDWYAYNPKTAVYTLGTQ